ncbi:hypothetical protein RIF29_22752 [Crotalaria pallida]|uniref:Uncharacterized protein n=1 Tax=Crotalaria pallida TaxID=3830 RepID=A0AAN9IEP2_CROPI
MYSESKSPDEIIQSSHKKNTWARMSWALYSSPTLGPIITHSITCSPPSPATRTPSPSSVRRCKPAAAYHSCLAPRPSLEPPQALVSAFSDRSKVLVMAQGSSCKRKKPNVLVTGTPGTGRTTLSTALAEATQLRHINTEDLVKEKNLHDGWDDELDCFILNEDLVCDELEDVMEEGGNIVDYHGSSKHGTGAAEHDTDAADRTNGTVYFVISTTRTQKRRLSEFEFKTRCFENGELLVIEGDATAMLPTLTVEQGQ